MLETLISAVVAWLASAGLTAVAQFRDTRLSGDEAAFVCVGVRECDLASSGGGDYLGVRTDASGNTAELYGFRLDTTFALDIYAPENGGAAACAECFGGISAAMGEAPSGLKPRLLKCGAPEYDRLAGMFRQSCELSCAAYLIAESDEGSDSFSDFKLKGTITDADL